MAALNKNRNTAERIPAMRQFEAGAKLYTGALVALNSSGKAVPASDTAGLTVIGRAEMSAEIGQIVTVKSGCFRYANSADSAKITAAEIGGVCYVADDQTVGKTGGTNSIAAGIVYDVESKGVWVIVGDVPVAAHTHEIAEHTHEIAEHTHAIADVNGLQAALDGKANVTQG